jgi:hypothetical protein
MYSFGGPATFEDLMFRVWVAEPKRCYVDQLAIGGSNTGEDWDNAFTDLQAALGKPECTEIWVAQGTYKPTSDTNMSISFTLRDHLALYGGFAGYETTLAERKLSAHPTILSGDLGESGGYNWNSQHVVFAPSISEGARLDGFTITGGLANSSILEDQWGGGMLMVNSNVTLFNVIFHDNYAFGGGGLFISGGDPILVNVLFMKNTAQINGGALHLFGDASAALTNVTIAGNHVLGNPEGNAGGIALWDTSSLTMFNTIVYGNTAPSNPQLWSESTDGNFNAYYSLLEGGCPVWAVCESMLPPGADPQFVNLPTGDLHLRPSSPAINAGNNDVPYLVAAATDLGGIPRIAGGRVDLGAYEFCCLVYLPAVLR